MPDHRHHWRRWYLVPSDDPNQLSGKKVYTEERPDVAYYVGWECECGEQGFSTEKLNVDSNGRKRRIS